MANPVKQLDHDYSCTTDKNMTITTFLAGREDNDRDGVSYRQGERGRITYRQYEVTYRQEGWGFM